MLAIDRILDTLGNGEWHPIKEVAQKTRVSEVRVELISNFLAAYDFLEFDRVSKKIKLSPQLQRFLRKIGEAEKETVGRKHSPRASMLYS